MVRMKDIFFTEEEINWRERPRKSGQGDLQNRFPAKSIVEELNSLVDELLDDEADSKMEK